MATGNIGGFTYTTSGTKVTWTGGGNTTVLPHPSHRGRDYPLPPLLPISVDKTAFAAELAAINACFMACYAERNFAKAFELIAALGFSVKTDDVPQAVITGATNATPIVITSAGHGYVTGQAVTISGVGGNTAANGTWAAITVVNANTYSLDTSVGNGAYTSGGLARNDTVLAAAKTWRSQWLPSSGAQLDQTGGATW